MGAIDGAFDPACGEGQTGESAGESRFSACGFRQITSLSEPQFHPLPHGLMAPLSGWGEGRGEEGFLFGIGQEEQHWCGNWGSGPSPHSALFYWVTPNTSPEGARLPGLLWTNKCTWTVEMLRKVNNQGEFPKGDGLAEA